MLVTRRQEAKKVGRECQGAKMALREAIGVKRNERNPRLLTLHTHTTSLLNRKKDIFNNSLFFSLSFCLSKERSQFHAVASHCLSQNNETD